MIAFQEIAFTAYPVTDLPRARAFYEGVLGLKPNGPDKPVPWVEYEVGAGVLALGSSPNWPPSRDGASVALEVADFPAAIAVLRQHQVEFVVGPLETPVCHMATVRDPDGNRLTLHRRKAR